MRTSADEIWPSLKDVFDPGNKFISREYEILKSDGQIWTNYGEKMAGFEFEGPPQVLFGRLNNLLPEELRVKLPEEKAVVVER